MRNIEEHNIHSLMILSHNLVFTWDLVRQHSIVSYQGILTCVDPYTSKLDNSRVAKYQDYPQTIQILKFIIPVDKSDISLCLIGTYMPLAACVSLRLNPLQYPSPLNINYVFPSSLGDTSTGLEVL